AHSVDFPTYRPAAPRHLPSFPTRRSSDLAPRSYPNNSDSSSCSGSAAQFSAMNGPPFRGDARWMKRATTSFPVPESPLTRTVVRSEEHTSELQSPYDLVCRLLLEKKNRHS